MKKESNKERKKKERKKNERKQNITNTESQKKKQKVTLKVKERNK